MKKTTHRPAGEEKEGEEAAVSHEIRIFAAKLENYRKIVMKIGNHSLGEWVTATRPWSFPASMMPVAVTLAYLFWAGHEVNWVYGVWALLNIVVFHAAGNTWSDYFDYKCKVDAADTFGAKSLTGGLFSPTEFFRLSLGLLCVALAGGLALTWCTGWELLLIGAGGAFCSLLYPALKYRSWGDVVILFSYALLPTLGTTFVASGLLDADLLWLSLPYGLITVSILHANNTRDVLTDRRAGINTLAMRAGVKVSVGIYLAEVLLPYALLVIFAAAGWLPWTVLLAFLSLPMALKNSRLALSVPKEGTKAIAGLDQLSAQLQLVFSLLLIVSLVCSSLFF